MIIYEVIVKVSRVRAEEYRNWIGPHSEKVMKEKGFLRSEIYEALEEERSEETISFVIFSVRYEIQDLESLQAYFKHSASSSA